MKKVLWLFIAVLMALVVTSCVEQPKPEPEPQPIGKTITVDGTLTEWETLLITDLATDSKWGSSNEIYSAGICFDAAQLYIGGEYTKDGYNNFIVIVDISEVEGATNTAGHPWQNRMYAVENGDIDLVIEAWDEGLAAWKVTSEGFEEITDSVSKAFNVGEHIKAEFAIPLETFGITNASTELIVKAAFVLTGGTSTGDDGTVQWAADFLPEQEATPVSGDSGYQAPVMLKNMITYQPAN
ncbi:hypothetical protein QO062_03150 [Fervidobacterium pennivorans subsp. carthaginiensis]|jgi:hypothetical protein|uniref:hypothetical protein n=1 Tax=Fervidobacterium pennivorans TaxID=93466 RepID=UPI00355C565E